MKTNTYVQSLKGCIFMIALFSSMIGFAQQQIRVSGKVIDEGGPIPVAEMQSNLAIPQNNPGY